MKERDWRGNSRSTFTTLGARNFAHEERQRDDFYATDPHALELLIDELDLSEDVWECACGAGHLSKVLEAHGHNVRSTDLYDRGYGESGVDFLKTTQRWDGDILTNPPYKYAMEFVKHALYLIPEGHKVIMFLKVQFLEGKRRRKSLFDIYPPKYVYVSSDRLCVAMNGEFEKYTERNAVAYAWYVWEKGYKDEPRIRWFN